MPLRKIKFSPSHAERWMNCPGALNLCATLPEPPSSKYAMEGTAAHELAAVCLKKNENAAEWVGEPIEVDDAIFTVTKEMAENVQVYLDAVRADMEREGIELKDLAIEKKFSLVCMPEIKGTNDASFSSYFGKLFVYDYKHGAGTYVEATDNPQLAIYALGAWEENGGINEEIEMCIIQPRFKNADVAPVRKWSLTKKDLFVYRERVSAAVVNASKMDAPLKAGDWCGKTFCPAFGVCPAVRKDIVNAVDPKIEINFPDPAKLAPLHIARILELSGHISDWARAVQAHAEKLATETGVKIPGYKLVKKMGRRAWKDPLTVENEFEHEFGEAIYTKELKSPAQLEKIVGKDRVNPLTIVPENGVQLVPESAKGEPVIANPGQVFNVLE